MGQAPRKRVIKQQEYEITLDSGETYVVTANDDQHAERIGSIIKQQVADGNPQLKDVDWQEPVVVDQPAKPESSIGGTLARSGVRGALANFGDEVASFGNAAGLAAIDNASGAMADQQAFWDNPDGFWAAFNNNMEQSKRQYAADDEQHPIASGVGQVGGAVAVTALGAPVAGRALLNVAPRAIQRAAIPLIARAEAASLGAPVRTALTRGAAEGTVGGYVSGFGAGDTLDNRLKTAGSSAFAGGVGGTVLSGGITGLSPAIKRYASVLLGKGNDREAVRQIVTALGRDGFDVTSPTGVQALRAELQSFTGKPVSLADIGSATRARAGVGLRAPSGAQQQSIDQVMARSQGQGQRLATDVRANVSPRTDVHALDEALVDQRAAEALPLRDKALFEEGTAPQGIEAFRGGAPFDPTREAPSWFTPSRKAAEDYSRYHTERFGTPGEVQTARLNIRNPAEQDVVFEEARRLGLEDYMESSAEASVFDPDLQGGVPAVRELIESLKAKGYDGARLPDNSPYDHKTPIEALIPFENSQVLAATAGGRKARMVEDDVLNQLANEHPMAQRALKGAVTLSQSERARKQILGEPLDDVPEILAGEPLDYRTADYLKRYLDKEVDSLYRRGQSDTFSAAEAGEVEALRNAIRERMRSTNDEYGQYLDSYSGSSEMIDALRAGRGSVPGEAQTVPGFDRLDPERIIAQQGKRSGAAQELYRVGAARRLEDIISNTRDTARPASRILNSPEARERLAATGVPEQNMQNLTRSVQQERQLNLLPDELAGSQTAQRQVAHADADAGVSAQIPFNPGSPFGWIGAGLRAATNRASLRSNSAVNEAALPRLLETNPAAIERTIAELTRSGEMLQAEQLRRAMYARRTARSLGAVLGSPMAIQEDY